MRKMEIAAKLIIGSFLLLLGWFTFGNIPTIIKSISENNDAGFSIQMMNGAITSGLKSDSLFHKSDLINISGLYGKLTGRQYYNGILVMKNGMLVSDQTELILKPSIIEPKIEALKDINEYINNYGGKFVYIQLPAKLDMEDDLMPPGHNSDTPLKVEGMLAQFRDAGIDIIDTLPLLSQTAEDLEANFYRTDHHWKPTAAFKAYQIIMNHLRDLFPKESFNDEIMDMENWSIHEMPEQFLGSRGKHVGIYFGGIDALQWMTPDFETEFSYYDTNTKTHIHGDYTKAFIREKFLDPKADKFHTENFNVYIGGDYPLVTIQNLNASSDLRILMIKDSYDLPLITYLAAQFREIVTIDPRHNKEYSIKQYISQTHPDIVMMSINVGHINDISYFKFTEENDALLNDNKTVVFNRKTIQAENISKESPYVIFDRFEGGKHYTLSIPSILVSNGPAEGLSLTLFDNQLKRSAAQTVMDISWCNKYTDCEWTFRIPNNEEQRYSLQIYAENNGETSGDTITLKEVTLLEQVISAEEHITLR